MAPFEARFRLATPICLNHPYLHLDSLISHAAIMAAWGRRYYTLPTKRVVDTGAAKRRLGRDPLRRWGSVACASVSFFEPQCEFHSIAYFKRFEADRFPAEKVNRGSGHFRDWMLRACYLPAREAVFYGHGDVDMVRWLLGRLTALGNDTRVGWGEVAALEVREIAEDYSIVRDGVAMRPIPAKFLADSERVASLAWMPPYWSRKHIELCAVPGARIRFHENEGAQ